MGLYSALGICGVFSQVGRKIMISFFKGDLWLTILAVISFNCICWNIVHEDFF